MQIDQVVDAELVEAAERRRVAEERTTRLLAGGVSAEEVATVRAISMTVAAQRAAVDGKVAAGERVVEESERRQLAVVDSAGEVAMAQATSMTAAANLEVVAGVSVVGDAWAATESTIYRLAVLGSAAEVAMALATWMKAAAKEVVAGEVKEAWEIRSHSTEIEGEAVVAVKAQAVRVLVWEEVATAAPTVLVMMVVVATAEAVVGMMVVAVAEVVLVVSVAAQRVMQTAEVKAV